MNSIRRNISGTHPGKRMIGHPKWKKVEESRKGSSTIWFTNKKEELKGFRVLLDTGVPTFVTKDDKYVINEFQYNLLKENEIKFRSD